MTDLLTASKKALRTLEHHEGDITYLAPLKLIEELREAIQEEEQRRVRTEPLRLEIYRILLDANRIASMTQADEIASEIIAIINAPQPVPDETPITYFMTVEWCSDGYRGIFCHRDGIPSRKDGEPHTQEEMDTILGPFTIILDPRSEPFTEEEIAEYTYFRPLAEYSNQYGIALRECDVPQRVSHDPTQKGEDSLTCIPA